MKKVGVLIDRALIKAPSFFKESLKRLKGNFGMVILDQYLPEFGGWEGNFSYRIRQLGKLGIDDFDALFIVDGDIDRACRRLGIVIIFDHSQSLRNFDTILRVL